MVNKNEIIKLKEEGYSYNQIASKLGMPLGSVKSIINRSLMVKKLCVKSDCCVNCGKAITQNKNRTRKFCSDSCRRAYWVKKSNKTSICPCCNREFVSSSRNSQIYCSRECYLKGVSNNGNE